MGNGAMVDGRSEIADGKLQIAYGNGEANAEWQIGDGRGPMADGGRRGNGI